MASQPCSQCTVVIATNMVTISGTATARVARPSSSRMPPPSSAPGRECCHQGRGGQAEAVAEPARRRLEVGELVPARLHHHGRENQAQQQRCEAVGECKRLHTGIERVSESDEHLHRGKSPGFVSGRGATVPALVVRVQRTLQRARSAAAGSPADSVPPALRRLPEVWPAARLHRCGATGCQQRPSWADEPSAGQESVWDYPRLAAPRALAAAHRGARWQPPAGGHHGRLARVRDRLAADRLPAAGGRRPHRPRRGGRQLVLRMERGGELPRPGRCSDPSPWPGPTAGRPPPFRRHRRPPRVLPRRASHVMSMANTCDRSREASTVAGLPTCLVGPFKGAPGTGHW